MKVSIIIPVYNVEPYIIRCFNSIKNQTYPNIEAIFVDDCSPDNSIALIKQQVANYSGAFTFKIITHKVNRGLSVARNSGTYAATGDYIYYLDSDDEITIDCIETLVKVLKKYPESEIVQGNTKSIPKLNPSEDWRNLNYKNFPEYSANHKWIKQHCLDEPRIPVNAWNKLIKRTFILEHHLFFKEGIIHEDDHWLFFVAKHLKHIAFSKAFGYLHYEIENSIMNSGSKKRSLESNLIILKDWSNNLDKYLLTTQKNRIYIQLRNTLLIVNKEGENEVRNKYKDFIKKEIKLNFTSFQFHYCAVLSLMFLPKSIYKTKLIQKTIGLILKLS